MNLRAWLEAAAKELAKAGITTARLDCLVLLEDATGKDRSYVLAHGEDELNAEIAEKLDEQIERRKNHEPLAYIRGKSEFYGREFMVNMHTLEPRPETETMIQLLKELIGSSAKDEARRVADIGSGSGCIAITAKLEISGIEVVATDISEECIKVGKENARKLLADVKFYKGNLLEPLFALRASPFALLCNLPYVPDSHTINQAAMQEPKLAIFGGSDGLDLYRQLFDQVEKFKLAPKFILTESLPFQHHGLATIARHYGYLLENTDDFIQVFQREG